MRRLFDFREHAGALRQLLVWTLLVLPVGVMAGSASALFLWSLQRVTEFRWQHGWLLFLLPVAGVVVGWIYHRLGRSAAGGNNLIIEQIHAPGGGVPRRMVYNNLKAVVEPTFTSKERLFNRRFVVLANHYLLEPVACTPASGREEDQVEKHVGNIRE